VKRLKSPPGIDVDNSLSQSDILAIDAVSADTYSYCILSALPCKYDIVVSHPSTLQAFCLVESGAQAPQENITRAVDTSISDSELLAIDEVSKSL